MSSIPNNLARVPQILSNQVIRSSLLRTQQALLRSEVQLASGFQVNRPSDDAAAASAISVLDDVIERRDQRLRNLAHADAVMNNLDAALGDVSNLLLEAKGIASSQIGLGSTPETRESQAAVIDAMLNEVFNIANRQYQDIHFFGGSQTDTQPMEDLLGGIRYRGQGSGMITDLGIAREFPITLSADAAFGAMSSRIEVARDLNPSLTGDTRLDDVNGAIGFGVRLGSIFANVNGNQVTIDLGNAHTLADTATMLQDAIQQELDTNFPGETIAVQIDPVLGQGLEITTSAGATVTFSDISAEATAADLGLTQTFSGGTTTVAGDLNAQITGQTLIQSLDGLTSPLGSVRLENGGQRRDLDLSSATTVQDIMNAVEGLNLGIRVEISEVGDRLNFVNELSGSAMSIGEVAGGKAATELGVRTFALDTSLDLFNSGLGVDIVAGSVNPVTGLADPDRDKDFQITLKDGRSFDVDLAGALTVGDVLSMINTAATNAGVVTGAGLEFVARLASDGNGIVMEDNTVGTMTTVASMNGSFAAENLGILGNEVSAIFAGEDRASVQVDGVFTRLINLRDALMRDDERGITFAGDRLDADIDRVARARATVGVRANRVTTTVNRQEDLRIQDQALRSEVRDLDFTEAAIQFTALQQQLQAALATAGQVTSLTLLDFLR
ncbi:MAG: flagellin [Planctomycetota bacterium]